MNICLICGQETIGAIGAAGLFWKNLCQPCKDEEDGVLAKQIELINQTFLKINP